MGKRGPKPKPTAIRLLEGNPSRKPLNDSEPSCSLPPIKPAGIVADEIASHEWDRVIAAMPPELYTALDVPTLTSYAQAWSISVAAQHEIAARGITEEITVFNREGMETGRKIVINPAVSVWKSATDTILKCGDRLGLSPSARSRLHVPKNVAAAKSSYDGLLGRPASSE